MGRLRVKWTVIAIGGLLATPWLASAWGETVESSPKPAGGQPAIDILTEGQWQRVDDSVDRALTWLASRQQRDGSFPTLPQGQPGVTSLCVMAFLSHGHLPGEGPYGQQLNRAIQYVQSCQKQNGMLAVVAPNGPEINRQINHHVGGPATYNHAISSLLLSEAFAVSNQLDTSRSQEVIEKSLRVTFEMQGWRKRRDKDRGGWRYLHRSRDFDSDLSVTGWQLMFLRSAKNAGFDVDKESIDEAVGYVRRCFQERSGTFNYATVDANKCSRAMAGAGVLALAHAGYHNSPEAQLAGKWILQHHFQNYNGQDLASRGEGRNDRYHYGLFNCSQAMYQLGGQYWERFFPQTVEALLASQRSDGAWPTENYAKDRRYGKAYTTALVLLSLGTPNQLLPVFQR